MTLKEVAFALRLHPETVRRKVRQGTLPAVRTGDGRSAIRVDRQELASWLEEHRNSGEAA